MPVAIPARRPFVVIVARPLIESYQVRVGRLDKEAGIAYGCKLCGRFSDNCHDVPGVTRGTEYSARALRDAVPVYEGRKVFLKHAARGKSGDRGPFDYFGVVRNVRYDPASECPRGNLHYKRTHPSAREFEEAIDRDMVRFGFSHHIPAGGYTAEVRGGRLVVTAITAVSSVDLVNDPATTKTLWESRSEPTTPRPKVPTGREFLESILEEDEDTRPRLIVPRMRRRLTF